MVTSCTQVEKGREPLDLVKWERNASGDSRRPSWRARSSMTTGYIHNGEGFEVPHESRTLLPLS